MGIKSSLSLVRRSKIKEGRTPPLNANNLPGKNPAVGINDFEGVGPEWLMPKRNPCYVLEESRIWRGREGNRPTSACPLYYLSLFLYFLSSFLCFLSYLFLFFLLFSFTLLSFTPWIPFLFPSSFRARQGSFYSACRDQILPFYPLTLFVWSGCTYRPPKGASVCHLPLSDKRRYASFVSPP